MVPNGVSGVVEWAIGPGEYIVDEVVAKVRTDKGALVPLTMVQRWPVRVGRPYKHKYNPVAPLQSGQRIIDTMFPIAKGGTAAVPGPSAPARPWSSTSWPSGPTWTSWCTWAAASGATR